MRLILITGFTASLALSCVAGELRQVTETRDAYEACVAEHSESYGACRTLKQAHDVASERYEKNARRAWGCGSDEVECPQDR